MADKQRIEFHSPDGFSYSSQSGSESDAPKIAIWLAVGVAAMLLAAVPIANSLTNADEVQRLERQNAELERQRAEVEARAEELERRKSCAIGVLANGTTEGCEK